MYKYFIIIAITLGSLFSMETVAIIDLEPFGVSSDDAKALTQRLTSQMIQIGKYTIVERSEMKRLLDEQKFQYSGCVDVACAVEIGKMLGAKTMVVGSVSKVGTVYSVDARMIDVKSAENYISANYTTAEDIGILLMDGMESIANQLCEVEYSSKLDSDVVTTNSNQTIHKPSIENSKKNHWKVTLLSISKLKKENMDRSTFLNIQYKSFQFSGQRFEICRNGCRDYSGDLIAPIFDKDYRYAWSFGFGFNINIYKSFGLNAMYYNNFFLDDGTGVEYESELGELYTFGLTYQTKSYFRSNFEIELGSSIDYTGWGEWGLIGYNNDTPLFIRGKLNLIILDF